MDKIKIIEQINLCDGIILQGGITSEVYESFIAKNIVTKIIYHV